MIPNSSQSLFTRQNLTFIFLGAIALAAGIAKLINKPVYPVDMAPEISVALELSKSGGSSATFTNIAKTPFYNAAVISWYPTGNSLGANFPIQVGQINPGKSVLLALPYPPKYFLARPEYLEVTAAHRSDASSESMPITIKGVNSLE